MVIVPIIKRFKNNISKSVSIFFPGIPVEQLCSIECNNLAMVFFHHYRFFVGVKPIFACGITQIDINGMSACVKRNIFYASAGTVFIDTIG